MAFGTSLTSISTLEAVEKEGNHKNSVDSSSNRKDVLIGILLDFIVGQVTR